MRQRRIGTVTLGLTLVAFGVLFLVHIFGGVLDYILIFHFWPAILVVLGVEILFYTLISPTGNEKYDFGALVILFLLTGFTMCMAGADWLLTNVPENVSIHW